MILKKLCFVFVVLIINANLTLVAVSAAEAEAEPKPSYTLHRTYRTMGLYHHISYDTSGHVALIEPQYLHVYDQQGPWLQVCTWMGMMWLYLDFEPPRARLDAFIGSFGNRVSLFYENLETGFSFEHNADRVFFGASATKGAYALWVYHLAEAGYTDLETLHTFTEADRWGGSGIIQRMPAGSRFTEGELLRLALSYSDNVAFRMLVRRIHGVPGFRGFVEEIGGDPSLVHSVTYSRLSAREAGNFARHKHYYIESAQNHSAEFQAHLLANRYAFVVSDHPVASKSGWAVDAFHDIAIVYAPSPYTLSILSAGTGGASDRRMFHDISMAIQEFNDLYFPIPINTTITYPQ